MERSGLGAITTGERVFRRLGLFLVRHPWYPIIFWVALLLVAAPFLSRIGSVTDNSATSLPNSAPSVVASDKIASLFPNRTAASDSLVLLVGPNLLGPTGQRSVLALSAALSSDPKLTYIDSVNSVYTAYGSYLVGQARLGLGALATAFTGHPNVWDGANSSAALVWGPPALFVANWQSYGSSHPSQLPSSWNYPAYNLTAGALGSNATALVLLNAFYSGAGGSGDGFNGTAGCDSVPATVVACADRTARLTEGSALPVALPASQQLLPQLALERLAIENYTNGSETALVGSAYVGAQTGLPGGFMGLLWSQFPGLAPSPLTLGLWVNSTLSAGNLSSYPLPLPGSIEAQFVAANATAEIVIVTYSVGSGYTDSQGRNPVYADVDEIRVVAAATLAQTDPARTIELYETGAAPLDQAENQVLDSSLAIVLPLTILVLLGITIVYFRAPLTPILTFGGLGIALGLGVAAVVLIGTFVTHVDVTSLELQNTFVLGIGTDYSIFLVARFREELYHGASVPEAVVTSVTWAGQSVATSGATAIISTLALAFSGVTLLSQWGIVLSVAVLLTVLICLTTVPAFLVLLGRRTFWPATGARFARQSERVVARARAERTYFFRAGRFAARRSRPVMGIVLIASIPLLWLALNVPLGYDFYDQLPGGLPATDGLNQLGAHFGPGYAFPIQALVSFSQPLVTASGTGANVSVAPNAAEFTALAALTFSFANTSGITTVVSPIGPFGANLSSWLNLSRLPLAPRSTLLGLLAGFVGSDGRSVLLTVVPAESGLAYASVSLLGTLEQRFEGLRATQSGLSGIYFAGGAPLTRDLQQQTSAATERLLVVVSIGLILVLFAVLRSWIIPLLAVATIGVSLGWSWAISDLVLQQGLGIPLFFFVPTVLFILILGLGIDYNIFLLTRVREERLKGQPTGESVVQAVAATGGIITAAAVILASAFAILTVGQFLLLRSIGFAVAVAILLDAMVVRTYLVPSALHLLGERVWALSPFSRRKAVEAPAPPRAP